MESAQEQGMTETAQSVASAPPQVVEGQNAAKPKMSPKVGAFIALGIGLVVIGSLIALWYYLRRSPAPAPPPGPGPTPTPSTTWSCSQQQCVAKTDGTGSFTSEAACVASGCESTTPTPSTTTWSCSQQQCVASTDGTGNFSSEAVCLASGCESGTPTPSPLPPPAPAPAPTTPFDFVDVSSQPTSRTGDSSLDAASVGCPAGALLTGCSFINGTPFRSGMNGSAYLTGTDVSQDGGDNQVHTAATDAALLQCAAFTGSKTSTTSPPRGYGWAQCVDSAPFGKYQIVWGPASEEGQPGSGSDVTCPSGFTLIGCTGKAVTGGGLLGTNLTGNTCAAISRALQDDDQVRSVAFCAQPADGFAFQVVDKVGPTVYGEGQDTNECGGDSCESLDQLPGPSSVTCDAGFTLVNCSYFGSDGQSTGAYVDPTNTNTCLAYPAINGGKVAALARCLKVTTTNTAPPPPSTG